MTDSSVVDLGVYSILPLKSGQTQCWDGSGSSISCSGTGQDGETQVGIARTFTEITTGVIRDNVTGLIWEKCPKGLSGGTCSSGTVDSLITFATATTQCSSTTTDGRTWRVPTIEELQTLVDYTKSSNLIFSDFPGTIGTTYWSSTEVAFDTTRGRTLNFFNGSTLHIPKTSGARLRCVSAPASRGYVANFTDQGDGTIKDNSTGLIWQKCSQGQSGTSCTGTASDIAWSTALTTCTGLGTGWRLPNINELKTILSTTESNTSNPLADLTNFPNTAKSFYWTSTTYTGTPANAWYISFNPDSESVNATNATKTNSYKVRCVKTP